VAAAGLADEVVVADARDPVAVAGAVGDPVAVTVVCVDVGGCVHGAILATAAGGTVVFFSMATSFPAAALGAEGVAADVEMLIGNGYVPGHAEFALELVRTTPGVRALFEWPSPVRWWPGSGRTRRASRATGSPPTWCALPVRSWRRPSSTPMCTPPPPVCC
jgi:hypothetical protein